MHERMETVVETTISVQIFHFCFVLDYILNFTLFATLVGYSDRRPVCLFPLVYADANGVSICFPYTVTNFQNHMVGFLAFCVFVSQTKPNRKKNKNTNKKK